MSSDTPSPVEQAATQEAAQRAAFDAVKFCNHVLGHANAVDGEVACACQACIATSVLVALLSAQQSHRNNIPLDERAAQPVDAAIRLAAIRKDLEFIRKEAPWPWEWESGHHVLWSQPAAKALIDWTPKDGFVIVSVLRWFLLEAPDTIAWLLDQLTNARQSERHATLEAVRPVIEAAKRLMKADDAKVKHYLQCKEAQESSQVVCGYCHAIEGVIIEAGGELAEKLRALDAHAD